MYSPNIYSQPNKYSPSTCLSLKSKTNKSPYGYNLFAKHCLKPNFFLQFILKEQKKCAVSSWRPVKVWSMGSGHSPLWAVGFCSRQSLAVGCHSGTEGDWTTSISERCSHGWRFASATSAQPYIRNLEHLFSSWVILYEEKMQAFFAAFALYAFVWTWPRPALNAVGVRGCDYDISKYKYSAAS